MRVGSRVRFDGLKNQALNGSEGVVVAFQNDRIGVELETDQRIAVLPCKLVPAPSCDVASGSLASGDRVAIKGLASRPDLNGRVGYILKRSEDSGRWGVQIGHQSISVKSENLVQLPRPLCLAVPQTRAALHRHDLVLLNFAASNGVAPLLFAEDRFMGGGLSPPEVALHMGYPPS